MILLRGKEGFGGFDADRLFPANPGSDFIYTEIADSGRSHFIYTEIADSGRSHFIYTEIRRAGGNELIYPE